MPDSRAAPARRIRVAPLWLGIRGCSFAAPPLVIVREGGQSSKRKRSISYDSAPFQLVVMTGCSAFAEHDSEKTSLPQIRRDLLAGLDQGFHRRHRFLEHAALGAVELDLDDALDAFAADDYRHADIKVLDAVFAVEPGRGRQHALLVAQIAFGHRDGGSGRRIERRAGTQQADDLAAAVAGAIDDLVDAS